MKGERQGTSLFQNSKGLSVLPKDGNQFLSTVFNGPRIGPHSFETRNFGEPCPVIQLFAFHLFYGLLAILEDHIEGSMK
jgi:hypothetical protein